ncbi:hypothetical protein C0Q70_17120 [Pomacea canaliculata]|uniref:Uncharacterized protein n=1 Tax=Pomacea canaliculata TaxID=400727 RepID=A0A2T7NRR2_POMCA|nr:hypothetical protein C0Q70_17120 [Pomacea canaliculata]
MKVGNIRFCYTLACIGSVRAICGQFVGKVWKMCGQCVDGVRAICGQWADSVWAVCGQSMESVWAMCGKYVGKVWKVCGQCVDGVRAAKANEGTAQDGSSHWSSPSLAVYRPTHPLQLTAASIPGCCYIWRRQRPDGSRVVVDDLGDAPAEDAPVSRFRSKNKSVTDDTDVQRQPPGPAALTRGSSTVIKGRLLLRGKTSTDRRKNSGYVGGCGVG